ncbi:endonuclease MutS2 [Lactobacillus sp. DCY120]|uniref:Endonuclease MutS2 n=1 Tax=Bombilactobacillus apium TaxID=2675299 RepID=A0A850R1W6_9LACO|nr:endonuclease MutS2 [Bombilactobacillus apium]NVY97119.1 endonuclease MutS2 [Bombilactobacillus apium]
MNPTILETLEYSKIKTALAQFLITAPGAQQLTALKPSTRQDQVQRWLDETADGMELDRLGQSLPVMIIPDIMGELKRLGMQANLNGTELYHLSLVLQSTNQMRDFFTELSTTGIHLRRLNYFNQRLVTLPTLNERLQQSVDQSGQLLDTASEQLKQIRQTLRLDQQHVRERMESYLRGRNAKYLTETLITVRDNRLVLPVKAEARHHFGGVVHDQSASGQTVYVEPQGVLELNNSIQTHQAQEKQITERLLAELSDLLRPYQTELQEDCWLLGHFDFVNAKTRYALQLQATEPQLNTQNQVRLLKARHPLIQADQVVANTIELGFNYRNIIITGPNTGGKTITLKTVGLLELMAQSGLFLPVAETSQVAVFTDIFADIGDEQSIEQNLSTFSSHMDKIIAIMGNLKATSLVLLDELGAGTDPQEGAALAMALIEQISQSNCDLMVTTHYPELKIFAYNYPQTINASMEFDLQSLQPTYRFLLGIPGSSNAFDIAERLGMNSQVVQRARNLQEGTSQDLNVMIQDLEAQRKNYEQQYQQYQSQNQTLAVQREQLTIQQEQLNQQQEQILDQAKAQANQLLKKTQTEATTIIEQLRHWQQGQAAVKDDQLIKAQTTLKNLHQQRQLQQNKVLRREKRKQQLRVGDTVHVDAYDQEGTIVGRDKKGQFEVQLGILKMRLDPQQLTKVKSTAPEPQQRSVSRQRAQSRIPLQLDLRGERYEAAMAELDRYLDSALLAGYDQVTIIHGFGTGVIRKGVQKYLRQNHHVRRFSYAPASAGGQGATIVELG